MDKDKGKEKENKENNEELISPYSLVILIILVILFFLIYKFIARQRKTTETTFHVESPTFS